MRAALLTLLAAALIAQPAPADSPYMSAPLTQPSEHARSETLWIFDADFEDLEGDNAGWTTYDRTGTLAVTNYWHKSDIRIDGYPHLGDSTWWCGTYDDCWQQGRGYGNSWTCSLWRGFPELNGRPPGDEELFLEYDQRYAMEKDYDYGYVDLSLDGGDSWTTINTVTNPGFVGQPGYSQDWNSTDPLNPGHVVLNFTKHASSEVAIRFRFESDGAYSSQDQPNNPPSNSCLDGAWQIDNIKLRGGPPDSTVYFFDDCESPDDYWSHEAIPASGQVGIDYQRRYETYGGREGWMMSAYDEGSGLMVDGQNCWLWSPPIDISGVTSLVGKWEGWMDLPTSDDWTSVWLHTSDIVDCLYWDSPMEPAWGAYYGGPMWIDIDDDWDAYTGNDWLLIDFRLWNSDPTTSHGAGMAFDRVRVGVPMQTGVPDDTAASVTLGRPHPNPFSKEAALAFSVPARGRVTVRVVDVAGRVVRTLLEREVEAGEHPLSWDGRTDVGTRAASGVYFVRAEFSDRGKTEDRTAKLILLD